MKIRKIVIDLLFAALVSLAITYSGRIQDPYLLLLVFSISLFFVQFLFMCRESLRLFYEKVVDENEMIGILEQILYYKTKGSSLAKTLQYVIEFSKIKSVGDSLSNVRSQMILGSSFSDAFNLRFSRTLSGLKFSLFDSIEGPYQQISQFLSIHSEKKTQNRTSLLDSAQRSATIGMFLSTILPSFILFSFIGASIISQSQLSLLPLSFVLIIGIPIAYAINGLFMSRRFFAQAL